MHVDNSASWHVSTSEVKIGWSIAFVDYRVSMSALQRSRLERHGWEMCMQVSRPAGQHFRGLEFIKQGWAIVFC